ncbi:hypothetical protein PM082_021693 [Marasmius tenuissimus]|nr:hypothetical protein PM082_021693 [Marasmius tenuissimus]
MISEELPLTAELVQEDILLRFLASLNSKEVDDVVVCGVISSDAWNRVPEGVLRPTVVSTSTNTPIAVANNDAWRGWRDTLPGRNVLENGMTRFTLAGGGDVWLGWNWDAEWAWMAQAWSVFSARGISLDEDLSVFELIYPCAELSGCLSDSKARQRSEQPIYLFFQSLPPNLDNGDTSSLHFWSFDEDGQSPLSDDLCHDFGLPTELRLYQYFISRSWSHEAYSRLRQYQILRGFDPSTTDFARSLGYDENIFHPLRDSDRFAQVNQEPSLEIGASTETAYVSTLEGPTTAHPTQLTHGFKSTTTDSAQHTRVGDRVFQPANSQDRFEHVQGDSECEPLTSTASKAASAQSAGFLSTLLSPLSSTLSSESDILTIGF